MRSKSSLAFFPEEKHPKLHGILHNAATIDGLILREFVTFCLGMKGSFHLLTTSFCKASSPGSGGILGMSWPERNVTGNTKSRGPCLNLVNLNVLTLQPSAQFSKYKMEHTMAVNASEARRAAKLEISILQLSRSPHRLPWCFCGVS